VKKVLLFAVSVLIVSVSITTISAQSDGIPIDGTDSVNPKCHPWFLNLILPKKIISNYQNLGKKSGEILPFRA